ncbi:MAG: biopolymer transporter ExbD [Desulfuromonas thiophila]|nr:biopolymer transporter ExbD [Desulfuromonas thiophila]
MKSLRRRLRQAGGNNSEINISPLIDLVFLLLIFFMVTTNFVRDAGIEVERPVASSALPAENRSIFVAVSATGEAWFDGQQVDVRAVRGHVERALADNPGAEVIVLADQRSQTGAVVRVMDQCRLAGAGRVSLAADTAGGGGS